MNSKGDNLEFTTLLAKTKEAAEALSHWLSKVKLIHIEEGSEFMLKEPVTLWDFSWNIVMANKTELRDVKANTKEKQLFIIGKFPGEKVVTYEYEIKDLYTSEEWDSEVKEPSSQYPKDFAKEPTYDIYFMKYQDRNSAKKYFKDFLDTCLEEGIFSHVDKVNDLYYKAKAPRLVDRFMFDNLKEKLGLKDDEVATRGYIINYSIYDKPDHLVGVVIIKLL